MASKRRLAWTGPLYLPAEGGGKWVSVASGEGLSYAIRRVGGAYEIWTETRTGWIRVGAEVTASVARGVAAVHWAARVALMRVAGGLA